MNVLTVDFNAEDASQRFAESLSQTGFAVLTNHPLDWGLIEKAYAEWQAFFNSDAKHKYPFEKKNQDGYISPELSEKAKGEELKDIKEFYHLYFPHGRYPDEISDVTKQIFEQQIALGKVLLKWIEDNLPAELKAKLKCPISEMLSPERTLFRVLYYPPFTGDEEPGAIRAAAHEDINLITLLPSATEPGLQVLSKAGEWVDVPLNPKALIVNIGDMLQELTDHFYISTKHRVINPEGQDCTKARMSMPTFVHAKADAYLSERYPTADQYLTERLRELGLQD